MEVTTRTAIFFAITLLGAAALLQGTRHWQRQSADSHQVFAKQAFCTIIQQPIIHNSQPPFCLFKAHYEHSLFTTEYVLWIAMRGKVAKHKVPERLILSVVKN